MSSVVDNKSDDRVVAVLVRPSRRIVGVVDLVASASSGKNVVTTIVDIKDDTVASAKTAANSVVVRILKVDELEVADGLRSSPVNKAAAGITTVVSEPVVHDSRVATPATVGTVHRDRSHGTASTANGLRASAQLVATPLVVTLVPDRGIDVADGLVDVSSKGHSNNKSKNKNRTHF